MSKPVSPNYDVIVCGAGVAGLVTSIAAREAGAAKVIVLEKAPKPLRGGNTYYAGGVFRMPIRGMDEARELVPDLSDAEANSIIMEPYTSDQYYADMMRTTEEMADPEFVQVLVNEANPSAKWLQKLGVKWQINSIMGLRMGDKLYLPSGGHPPIQTGGAGSGLSDSLFAIAERKGVEISYETKGLKLLVDDGGRVYGIKINRNGKVEDLTARAVVMATGGFEANREMRAKYLGKDWDLVKVRGSRFSTGDGHKMALEIGAGTAGHWSGCHATQIDASAPMQAPRDLTDKTNRMSFNFCLLVNLDGKRFVDEGADFAGYLYHGLGKHVLAQPHRLAFQVYDKKVHHLLETRYATGTCITADTLEELGDRMGVNVPGFLKMVKEFNAAVQPGKFIFNELDNKHTEGIEPAKSNWALPIDTPPFEAYPVTCGITFSYGGLKINRKAQVVNNEDQVIPGLYSAGIIVGFLLCGYSAAADIPAGCVFGRIAGTNAAAEKY